MRSRLCLLHQLQQRGEEILESRHGNNVLGHSLVCRSFVRVDGLHELEVARIDVCPRQCNYILGDGCREEKGLARLLSAVRQHAHDLFQLSLEADIEHSISLVKAQSGQVRSVDATVVIGQKIVETARGANQQVAALDLGLAQHHRLVHPTDGRLDDNAGVAAKLAGFLTNLFSQLSSWRDDDGADVIGTGLVLARSGCEARVCLDDSLDGRDEEAKGLASSGPGLGDAAGEVTVSSASREIEEAPLLDVHILPLQGGVDAHGLDIGHDLIFHTLNDGADEVLMHAERRQVRKAGDLTIRARLILALGGGRRARVASRNDLTANGDRQDGRLVRRRWPWCSA